MSALISIFGSIQFHALCLVLISTAATQALIAIWAATSRLHWFWRALAVWAAITALLPIRAYQPAFAFAISSPLTVLLIRYSLSYGQSEPTHSSRSASFRYTLLDLL